MENQTKPKQDSPIHSFSPTTEESMQTSRLISVLFACIVAGVITGLALAFGRNVFLKGSLNSATKGSGTTKKVEGIKDKKTFKDSATGILQEGGFEGEGSYHLERPGGDSQNVYLTSSAVDLSSYVGQKITVWGETFSAEKAGWLMDVGMVEITK